MSPSEWNIKTKKNLNLKQRSHCLEHAKINCLYCHAPWFLWIPISKLPRRTGEIAQWLRALAILQGDPSLVVRIPPGQVAHNHLRLHVQEVLISSSGLSSYCIHTFNRPCTAWRTIFLSISLCVFGRLSPPPRFVSLWTISSYSSPMAGCPDSNWM